MSLPRFFLSDQVLSRETESTFPLDLSSDDMKHARVLRLRAGEHIAVIDAQHDYFECEIVQEPHDTLMVRISEKPAVQIREPHIVVVQGLAKGDKMDTVVRHATEVGATSFIPFASDRSVMKLDAKKAASKRARWQSIAKSAAMQAGRSLVPTVEPLADLSDVCEAIRHVDIVLVCWEEASRDASIGRALARVFQGPKNDLVRNGSAKVAIVIGPEGGLSDREVSSLAHACPQTSIVTLGQTILRTETAGIVAPALVRYELDRLAFDCADDRPCTEEEASAS